MSLSTTATLVSLALTLGTIQLVSALPIARDPTHELPKHHLLAFNAGQLVHVREDGNVTGSYTEGFLPGRFYYRHDGENISFHSVEYNGSYLHFVEVLVSVNVSTEFNSTSNSTSDSVLGFNSNATASNASDAVSSLKLVLGDISDEEEEGILRHHMWMEEMFGLFHLYSITLEDGRVCYLAFEIDGTPVDEPCLYKDTMDEELVDELQEKARLRLIPAF